VAVFVYNSKGRIFSKKEDEESRAEISNLLSFILNQLLDINVFNVDGALSMPYTRSNLASDWLVITFSCRRREPSVSAAK
jgi:hypothetical protein